MVLADMVHDQNIEKNVQELQVAFCCYLDPGLEVLRSRGSALRFCLIGISAFLLTRESRRPDGMQGTAGRAKVAVTQAASAIRRELNLGGIAPGPRALQNMSFAQLAADLFCTPTFFAHHNDMA